MKPPTRPVSIEQVRSLLKKSARDMKDAATPGLSSERVFTIRYEAGFSCAQAFALANKMEAPRDRNRGVVPKEHATSSAEALNDLKPRAPTPRCPFDCVLAP